MFLTFPCPIHTIFTDLQNKTELIDYVYTQKNSSEGVKKSNAGGWQSDNQYYTKNYNPIRNLIDFELSKFFSNKEIFSNIFTAKVKDLWINCNGPGDYNYSHNHPGSDMSGVLWLQTPENSGNIVFESPFSFNQYKLIDNYSEDFRNKSNIHTWFYLQPQEGLMILFPAHLNHSVSKNKSNQDRISVAFNLSLS